MDKDQRELTIDLARQAGEERKRIYIFGSVGSGKTTLARRLAQLRHLPMHELDNVVWVRREGGDVRRTVEQRDALLHQLIAEECWVIEGAQHGWTANIAENAELIIVLDLPYRTRLRQIMMRWVKQRLGREAANDKPSLAMLGKMLMWNNGYETDRRNLLAMFNPHASKVVVVRDRRALTLIGKQLLMEGQGKQV